MIKIFKPLPPPASEFARRGTTNGRAKLTENDVRMIRLLVTEGHMTCHDAGRKYELSKQAVSLIVRRKRWGHVQ